MAGGLRHWIDRRWTRPAPSTRAWYGVLAFGIATLIFGLYLGRIFPQTGPDIAPGYGSPVLAFEFARSQGDLEAIFGFYTDPLQGARLAAMRAGNERDYLYILLYAGFLASGCVALWRELRLRTILIAAALPVAAAIGDAWENSVLLTIQSAFALGDYSPAMATLPYLVAAKFLLLAATNVVIGVAAMRMRGWWAVFGAVAILAALPTVAAILMPAKLAWALIPSNAGGWLLLLALAAMGSWSAFSRKGLAKGGG